MPRLKSYSLGGLLMLLALVLLVVAFIVVCLWTTPRPAAAQEARVMPYNGIAYDFEKVTPGNAATGFTASKILPTTGARTNKRAAGALITAEANTLNFCFDGSAPTQSNGTDICHSLPAGASYFLRGYQNLAQFKCIDKVAGQAGTLRATFMWEN